MSRGPAAVAVAAASAGAQQHTRTRIKVRTPWERLPLPVLSTGNTAWTGQAAAAAAAAGDYTSTTIETNGNSRNLVSVPPGDLGNVNAAVQAMTIDGTL
jgi:hypothetical protein